MKCPKCRSEHVELESYNNIQCRVCLDCGFDERDELDSVGQQKASKKAKASYTPYKTGGSQRVRR